MFLGTYQLMMDCYLPDVTPAIKHYGSSGADDERLVTQRVETKLADSASPTPHAMAEGDGKYSKQP